MEYALFVTLGLWATLFVANPVARGAGLLLIILATLRALTEKDTDPVKESRTAAAVSSGPPPGAETSGSQAGDGPETPAGWEGTGENGPRPARPRKRVL